MAIAGVVLLAPDADAWRGLAAELVGRGLRVLVPPRADVPADLPPLLVDTRRVAAAATWLRSQDAAGPIVVVAVGECGRLLPALSLSQRAAGRLITGYVLVDSRSPAPAMDWPDAPVTWVATGVGEGAQADGALPARLRGFEVVELPEQGDAAARPLARVAARAANCHDH